MSAIKLEAYLEGHSLEQAREQARRLSEVDHCTMFVNVKAYRRPGTNEYIVAFAVSTRAGESVEDVFINGSDKAV